KEQHVDVYYESRFRILTHFKVLREPAFVAFDAGDIVVPIDLLANGLDLGKVWVVDLLIEFEGTKHVLIDNGFRAISQVPTELSEYLAWAVSQRCWSDIGCTFDDVSHFLQVAVLPDQGVEQLLQR